MQKDTLNKLKQKRGQKKKKKNTKWDKLSNKA